MSPATTYALSTTVAGSVDNAAAQTRAALAEQGFGILTEIDLAATLREKIGADIPPHLILGACRPPLAHAAVTAEPSIGLLLPCNVVIRAEGDRTVVEAMDPATMVTLTGNPALAPVADDARTRLLAALTALGGTPLS
ncbi:DUF302 domain-containing protein [Oryzobacter telluris]|uniref:DUF302 domain-containing protein n=1 Tax=Oryzobacter telluris TaxID=3149179 RepID=UPI00370D20E7